MRPGDRLELTTPAALAWPRLTPETAGNWPADLSVSCSAPNCAFSCEEEHVFPPETPDELRSPRTLRRAVLTLTEGRLRGGERIEFLHRLRMGWRAMRWEEPEGGRYELGLYRKGSEPQTECSPFLAVRAGPMAYLDVLAPSVVATGEPFEVRVTARDGFHNPVREYRGMIRFLPARGLTAPGTLRFRSRDRGVRVARGFAVARAGLMWLRVRDGEGDVFESNPIRISARREEFRTLWGELHGHTAISIDARSWSGTVVLPGEALRHARDVAGLDFAGLADHGNEGKRSDMTEAEWAQERDGAGSTSEGGRFVAFSGFEHRDRGDTNVHFLADDAPFWQGDGRKTKEELRAFYAGREVLYIPHLHGTHGSDVLPGDRLIEVFSVHGRFEFRGNRPFHDTRDEGRTHKEYVLDKLRAGGRLGFTAGSDDHSGAPGTIGLTAVFAAERTRASIWEALVARRCYATTGQRILLDFTADGAPLGSEIVAKGEVGLHIAAAGTTALRTVELLRDGEVIHVESGASPRRPVCGLALLWGRRGPPKYGSSSLLDVEGELEPSAGQVLAARAFACVSGPSGCMAKPCPGLVRCTRRGRHVLWSGPAKSHSHHLLEVDLAGVDDETLLRVQSEPGGDREMALGSLFAEERVLDAGPDGLLDMRLRAEQHPAAPLGVRQCEFTVADRPAREGSFYYVRVTQEDLGMAWSSPIWVDRAGPLKTRGPRQSRPRKDER
jgi:hypothetical protein